MWLRLACHRTPAGQHGGGYRCWFAVPAASATDRRLGLRGHHHTTHRTTISLVLGDNTNRDQRFDVFPRTLPRPALTCLRSVGQDAVNSQASDPATSDAYPARDPARRMCSTSSLSVDRAFSPLVEGIT